MLSDFRAAAAHPEYQVGAWMHGWKGRHPHVLEETQNGQLSLLIDQGVICENSEIQKQIRSPGWK